MTRARAVEAGRDAVWRVVADPARLPEWWPGVQRVEDITPKAWTKVLASPKGKTVRADYTSLESEPPRRALWRHEVAESPFERVLSESLIEIVLEPEPGAGTRVALTARHRPRGFARLGSLQIRLAAARQLEAALDGLQGLLAERE